LSPRHDPSPPQREAIEADLTPTLVLAGPGAGKTFCLIERIRFLIERRGFDPARICAVTFTNKAAEEIGLRLKKELGDRAEPVGRSTIHSLSVALLRELGSVLGIERGFGIADEEYQKEILSWCRVQPGRRGPLLGAFSLHRLMGHPLADEDARRFAFYRRQLAKRGMLDFEDLVLETARLLREHPDVAQRVRARWDYLLVDEFQDLNHVQYEIIRQLSHDHRAVFAVGDDDQSIFSWTGADRKIINRFLNDFGVKRPIVLHENHRSARQIFQLARRFVAQNPSFFEKPLVATRETTHPVEARSFDGDAAEEKWLLEELKRDRAASALGWGDIAILYRKHQIGEALEGRLMQEGVPCRLAQGRSVSDDQVVRYLIAALHLVISPRDPFYVSLFAKRVLPADLLDRLKTETIRNRMGLLPTMQREARKRPQADEDGRKIRRALAAMNNLPALASRHRELPGLIDELLSQRIATYRTLLEQRADELSDPVDSPAVRLLAEELRRVHAERRRVLIPPMGGLEIGLAGMLSGAGLPLVDYALPTTRPLPGDFVLGPGAGGGLGLALGTFKALQLIEARAEGRFADCVIFDLETTGLDRNEAEIVEIAAVRLRGWEVIDEFHTLVRPRVAIEAGAARTHGFSEADVAEAPYFETVWPAFHDFIGSDVLVAHNGYDYDIPILARMVGRTGEPFSVVPFDTLQLARTLFPRSARLEHLAERFGIDCGRAHHARDDVRTLAQVFRRLEEEKVARARRVGLSQLLDYLGMSLALSDPTALDPEGVMLKEATRVYPLNRFSNALEFYRGERERGGASAAPLDDLIDRLGGPGLMERVRATKRPEERYPNAVSRINRLMEGLPDEGLDAQIREFLGRLALSRSDGADADPDRVNLLTLHATKGLEFSRVYLVGMEDGQMLAGNGRVASDDEVEEARRLVYVGMTRAKDRLVMTRVGLRRHRPTGGHRFLDEMGLTPIAR
jgi:superfamily I DNA/RNA helicase/inhibitor of KinA sporulation pathway (predicted exonuclease)